MQLQHWKTALVTTLCAVACSQLGLAQVAPPAIAGTWECTLDNGYHYESTLKISPAGPGKWAGIGTNKQTTAPFHKKLVGTQSQVIIYASPGHPNHFYFTSSGPDDPNPSARGPWKQEYTGTLDKARLHWTVVHTNSGGKATWPCECVRHNLQVEKSKRTVERKEVAGGRPDDEP